MSIPPRPSRHPWAAYCLVMAATLLLTGCLTQTSQPRPAPAARVAPGSTEPLGFNGLSINAMRRGMEIGRYVWDLDCAPPYDPVFWTSGAGMRRGSTIDARFGEVMADTGFDVVGRHGGPDAPGVGDNRARFTVQGELRDIRLELCHRNNWLTGANKGVSGTGSARVDWSVYDARGGRLVHRLTTSGVSRQDSGVPQGDILLIEEAFAAAADRLAADPGFRAAVSRGGATTPSSNSGSVGGGGLDGVSDIPVDGQSPPVALTIQSPPVDRSASADPTTRVGAAQIRVGDAHGLVIGETRGEGGWQSLLLVPSVGSGDSVTVRPAPGVTLTGIVEGRDGASGFALVRVPARLTAAPARGGPLRVSDRVSVAAGRGRVSATGIIGGLPLDPRRGVSVIQADLGLAGLLGVRVELGDPLLDDSGAVIGLALGPTGLSAATPPGLIAFLPVGEILSRLGVDLLEGGADGGPVLQGPRAVWSADPARRANGARPRAGAGAESRDAFDAELDGDVDPPT